MTSAIPVIDFFWIINGWEGFGISRITRSLANQMRNDGKSVKFLSISKGRLADALQNEGFKVHCLNLKDVELFDASTIHFIKGIFTKAKQMAKTYRAINKVSKNYHYDVLVYGSPNLTLFASLLKKTNSTKVFLVPNVISDTYFLNINKYLYLLACSYGRINIIANSEYTASTFRGWGTKPHVLHLGVDPTNFEPNQKILEREKFTIQKNDIVYGIFARFSHGKAQDLVISAFSGLVKKYPDTNFKLLLVGLGEKDAFYERCAGLIKSNGLEDKVIVVETKKDIVPYYSLVDVMINSRRDAEPFGLTIIESMLMQKPVMAFGLGGPSETVLDNHTGWLVGAPTVEEYLKTLETSFSMRGSWDEIGENGRKHALKNFTIETVYTNLMKIINEIKK